MSETRREYPQNFLQAVIERCWIEETGSWRPPSDGGPSYTGHYTMRKKVCKKEVIPVDFTDAIVTDRPKGEIYVFSQKLTGTVVPSDRDLLDKLRPPMS